MADRDPTRLSSRDIEEARRTGTLDLSQRDLTALPAEIGTLTNVEALQLKGNRLAALPPEIGELTSLRTLNLSHNILATLPAEVGQLASLTTLDLMGNRLDALPPEIGRLSNLNVLRLDRNRLADLPPEIGQISNLRQLHLPGNQLAALPAEIGQLTELHTLQLHGNRLTVLPREVRQLTSLQSLDLGYNQLSVLPAEIGQLTSLQDLRLHGNKLVDLPPEIGRLSCLKNLNLGYNQLAALPRQFADLLAGSVLIADLERNPLRGPLRELIARGSDALATYLRSLKDAITLYEAKVLLVGEGNVGKTSLVAALAVTPFVEGRPTTHGIEIQSLYLRHPDRDADMTLRAWDFGGQEVYRISHQFFFSRRALYLLVWNAREGQEQNEVDGWLRRIRLRVSRDAQVLVVATHCDERRPELDYPYLKETFGDLLAGRYEVDNRSGHGIDELRQAIAIEAARLPQMGMMLSTRWTAARDEILALSATEPQIPYSQFTSICLHHLVNSDEVITLAELMHDLGQIIYYNDEGLRDFIVLKPEWLTKAISYVLEDKPTRQSRGILDHARLGEIWEDPRRRLHTRLGTIPTFSA